MKVKLIKIQSTHNNLRTVEAVGQLMEHPTVGHSFLLVSEPLNPEAQARLIRSSPIKKVTQLQDKLIEVQTENSTYHFETLE